MSNHNHTTRLAIQRLLGFIFPFVLLLRALYRQIRRPVTIGVRSLIVQDEQILLVRMHGSDEWVMPGGGVKRGETLRAAAEREAREETGCHVQAERLLGMYLGIHEGMTNHVAVFVCRPLTPPTNTLNIEIAEARYWPIDALPDSATSLHRRLREYAAGAQGLDGTWDQDL